MINILLGHYAAFVVNGKNPFTCREISKQV